MRKELFNTFPRINWSGGLSSIASQKEMRTLMENGKERWQIFLQIIVSIRSCLKNRKEIEQQRFLFRPACEGQLEALFMMRSRATDYKKAKKMDKKINSQTFLEFLNNL